jgi:choline dehydrogenase-like flavoprotein
MIHDASTLPLPGRLKADLCVVGSGPGGAPVATLAAEAGLSVVVLEAGAFIRPGQSSQREEEMLPRLMWYGGNQTATDRRLRILQGHGLGGSSLHNINLCKRVPDSILEHWQQQRGMQHLSLAAWRALY